MKAIEDLSHDAKVVLWCVNQLDDLRNDGILAGPDALTYEGVMVVQELIASGFVPTDEEIAECLEMLLTASEESE